MSDLPSFLQQTASGYVLTLSSGSAEHAMLCKAKTQWRYLTGIEAAAPRAGLNYGAALHLLLAVYYEQMLLREGRHDSPDDILAKHFAENPQPELGPKGKPEWRTQARALQAFAAYRERYPAEDFEVLGVEEKFECELGSFGGPAGDLVDVRFIGIKDLRVKWHDQLWVLDHKTMGEWSDLTPDEGKCSFQFIGYAYDERQRSKEAAGTIGNYLIARAPYAEGRKPTPRDLPRDQFERVAYAYSDSQLEEWHDRALGIARDLFRCWQEGEWPQSSTACAHWGRCEYYRLCWETDPAYRLSAALSADYRPRTPSPFGESDGGKERT